MGKLINCDCGFTVRGSSDSELLTNARAHIAEAHPDMVGKVTDDDLLGKAVDA